MRNIYINNYLLGCYRKVIPVNAKIKREKKVKSISIDNSDSFGQYWIKHGGREISIVFSSDGSIEICQYDDAPLEIRSDAPIKVVGVCSKRKQTIPQEVEE